ncbi:histone-like nucleoid-structuring protein, MvaT/MvaU family [Marinobacter sp. ELB17]|uniref:histone-like nucleoid-structuring protein, MvaT/MvaU family n=1 Tax=Marinobacter sp. ELB17 TaxID=270374 RepID=UPI0000F39C60|nr:histone-like nucleoid-structuring protein, MvaT/MvaU family [Marinobacter sp. ELB17]EAZ97232.1 transcriptional regulator MvaT, P16 subunit [Marinobacter sp. ELB17]
MAKITEYYKKKQLMEQLIDELSKLEDDESLKKDLVFERKIKELLADEDKSAKDAMDVLLIIDPTLAPVSHQTGSQDATPSGTRRALKKYTNPHTGEVVKTRGGNQKTLREWRAEFGAEAVHSWSE